MRSLKGALILFAMMVSLVAGTSPASASSHQQADPPDPKSEEPSTPAPRDPPPPPPSSSERPKPPTTPPPDTARPHDSPDGQWVWTTQYGWVWMPYGDDYTHVPPDGSTPNMYVYYPDAGWCWVVAPWLWGWGPMPYFGVLGPVHFGWWGYGLGHWYGFRGHYYGRGWHGGSYWHGGRWVGGARPRIGGGSGRSISPRGFSPRGSSSPRGLSGGHPNRLSPHWHR
jgi:hypothetical protein